MRSCVQHICPSRSAGLRSSAISSPALKLCVSFLAAIYLAFLASPALAATNKHSQLIEAQKLNDRGQFAEVIQALEPILQSDPDGLDEVDRAMAWNILGSAHQARGENEAARACYETAIKLVRTLPAAAPTYASALTNLGSLEINMGQLQAAENLLQKAKGISAKAGDHVVMVEVETNLAVLAIDRNDTHAARGFLADAFREAESTNESGDSDRAALYSIHGSLAAKSRDFATAVRDYQQSIDLWTRACGPKYYLIAVAYTLQAEAYRELGDYSRASSDLSAALTLLEQTTGKETQLYATTELAQARLFRATGANMKASQTEADAKSRLTAGRRQQCDACSISAAVF